MRTHCNFIIFLHACLIWLVLIAARGYEVGTNDSVEFLPYALFQYDGSLYKHDLFINSLQAMVPNERIFYAKFISLFVPVLEPALLALHFLFTVFMIVGMLKIAERFISNIYLRVLVTALILLTYKINTGANVFSYPDFQGATMAKALTVWALYFLIERNVLLSITFTALATFFQPLVGFHFFLISVPAFIYLYYNGETKAVPLVTSVLLYICTAGVYVAGIKIAQSHTAFEAMSEKEYIKAAFHFRLPHHFIPTHFSKYGLIINGLLLPLCLAYFYRHSRQLFIMLLTITAGLIVYTTGTLLYEHLTIISSWWFRTTIWIKLLGFVAGASLLERVLNITSSSFSYKSCLMVMLAGLIFAGTFALVFPETIARNPYHFPWSERKEPEIKISQMISTYTPKDAVLIHPFQFTALKYYGRRSSYVEFKTIARRSDFLKLWHYRIKEVYKVDYNYEKNAAMAIADSNFYQLTKDELRLLKAKGVTHIITIRDYSKEGFKKVCGYGEYLVFEL